MEILKIFTNFILMICLGTSVFVSDSHSQIIYSESQAGDELAFYKSFGEPNFVVGSFTKVYDQFLVHGDVDLFYQTSDDLVRVIGGRNIESWLQVLPMKGGEHVGFIKFFGELMLQSDTLLVSGLESFALARMNSSEILLEGKFTAENLSFEAATTFDDHIWVALRSKGVLKFNEQVLNNSENDHLVLLEIDELMNILSIETHEIHGELTVRQLIVNNNSWLIIGSYRNTLMLDGVIYETETFDHNGCVLEQDRATQVWKFTEAKGVFSVEIASQISLGNEDFLIGEYLGNVSFGSVSLETPMLNKNLFLYNLNAEEILKIGGTDFDQFVGAWSTEANIYVQLNFVNELEVSNESFNCQGGICSATLTFDSSLNLREARIDDSGELFLSVNSFLEGSNYAYCGQYQGSFQGLISDEKDWICLESLVNNNSSEVEETENLIIRNPVKKILYLDYKDELLMSYKVLNILGQVVQEGRIEKEISVEKLMGGLYFLVLYSDKQEKIYTFSKI